MQIAETARHNELERQVELCVRIAGLGFGPEVTRLALERKGVPPAAARLIALSVASSRAALRKIEGEPLRGDAGRVMTKRDIEHYRASRAARHFLGRVAAFFWFGVVAIGGGLALGWMAGFEHGAVEGYESVVRALATLFWR
jgi:hypothetical protein